MPASSASSSYARAIWSRTDSGTGADRIASLIACDAATTESTSPGDTRDSSTAIFPSSPASSTNARKAPVERAKPGATGISAAISSPRAELFPPND